MKKQIYLIPIIAIGASLVACNNQPKKFIAALTLTEALNLSNTKVVQGKSFKADITVKDSYKEYCEVPNTLIEVKVADTVLHTYEEEYFYTVDASDSGSIGHLEIPGKYIKGDVAIKASASADPIEIEIDESTDLAFSYADPHVGDKIEIDVMPQQDARGIVLPRTLGSEAIKVDPSWEDSENGDIDITECCDYKTNEGRTRGRITIPAIYNENQIVEGKLTISLKGEAEKYKVTASSDTLKFTNPSDNDLDDAIYGTEYVFKMEVFGESVAFYEIPNSLEIKVDGIPLGTTEYGIASDGIVTIDAACVTGKIEIKGEAVPKDQILVSFIGYGVKSSKSGLVKKGEDFVTEIAVFKGNKLPEKANLGIGIYDTAEQEFKWKPVDDTNIIYSVDGSKATLTIKANLTTNEIAIVAKARNLTILDSLDWETISSYSKNGYAPYLFEYGEETKAFTIDGLTGSYKARIIDFGRDPYKGTSRTLIAGMTFEFTKCIMSSQFSSSENPANSTYFAPQGKTNYESELYKNLNSTTGLYKKVPFSKYIVQVQKETMIGTEGEKVSSRTMLATSYNYMFPLSLYEMNYPNLHHGYKEEAPALGGSTSKPYYYYNNVEGTDKLIKEGIYWSRTSSEYEIASNQVNCILKDGTYHFMNTTGTSRLVSPAFCF